MPVLVKKKAGGKGFVKVVRRAVEATLAAEGFGPRFEVSVLICDADRIRELNRLYRQIDSPTDVLAFPQHNLSPVPGNDDNTGTAARGTRSRASRSLGDLAIALPVILQQAREHNVPVEHEMSLMSIHGTLHLLGYDHLKEQDKAIMWRRQETILESVIEATEPSNDARAAAHRIF